MPTSTPLAVRTLRYYTPAGANDCWPWTGCISRGYGQIGRVRSEYGSKLAHRVVYELLVGPIPNGLHLDHLCHTNDPICRGGPTCLHRRCVNPNHLEPVEPPENGRRVSPARRDFCPAGHKKEARRKPNLRGGEKTCNKCESERQVVVREERKNGVRPGPRLITCEGCKMVMPLCARNLCRRCYTRAYRAHRGNAARPGRHGIRGRLATGV